MKKFNLYLLVIILVFSSSVYATGQDSHVVKVRKTLGEGLSTAVKDLKTRFSTVETDIEDNKNLIKNDHDTLDVLIGVSKDGIDGESNPTVLDHAKKQIPSCKKVTGKSPDSECVKLYDLVWTKTGWTWRQPLTKNDCNPAPGESKVSDGKGGYKCIQNGTYSLERNGYGECNDPPGIKYSESKCVFKNSSTGVSYEVSKSNCSGTLPKISKVCGYKWSFSGYTACYSNNTKDAVYSCVSRVNGAGVSSLKCHHSSRPTSTKSCDYCATDGKNAKECKLPPPPPQKTSGPYTTGAWSVCKKTCGPETQTRAVSCKYDSCYGDNSTSKSCGHPPCDKSTSGPYTTGAWSTCKKSCGPETQTRSVSCKYDSCYGDNSTSRSCGHPACPTSGPYTTGAWSVCKKSCGTEYQTRSVSCKYDSCYGDNSTSKSCGHSACAAGCSSSSYSFRRGSNRCTILIPAGSDGQTVSAKGFGLCPSRNAGDAFCSGTFKCSGGSWSRVSGASSIRCL